MLDMILRIPMCKKGKSGMDSEEMREELESFVNQGIEEGWGGWPVKGWSFTPVRCGMACGEMMEVNSLDPAQEYSFPIWSRLDRLFQTHFQDMNRLS
jgi:hypothetical protein